MWWDDDTVEKTVTKQFVCSRLSSKAADRLDQPLGFGDELTNSTYWEWLEEKSKKTFLVLADLGLPNQIFDLIDDSLDDEDLPMALDEVARLKLTPSKDEKTAKKFYHRQFHYLLRPLQKGCHIDYDNVEVIPLDVVDKKHAGSQSNHVDKVELPGQPGAVFCRCRIRLGPDHVSPEEFMSEINGIKEVQNEHLLSYWASYTHKGYGYILFTPASEFSLKSLLITRPGCLKKLEKKARREVVMNWIYCLVNTVCFFHDRRLSHGNIRPSTVNFTKNSLVFFSGFRPFLIKALNSTTDDTSLDKEIYDYAAPEKVFSPPSSSSDAIRKSASPSNSQASSFNSHAADVFSLGCVILELLSFLFKKQGRPFAAHRAEKHRAAGRGSPFPDSSFHANLGQVESWLAQLAKDALKKDDQVFRGVAPMLYVVQTMLAFYPSERPTAREVRERICQILAGPCGIPEPHCVRQDGNWDFGMGSLRLSAASMASTASSSARSFFSTQRKSASQEEDAKRGSRGSGGSASVNGSARETEMGAAISRARNGSHGSQNNAQQILNQWKAAGLW
jgi:serine/threonine protein kinase